MLRDRTLMNMGNINADFWGTFTKTETGGTFPITLLSGNTYLETINLSNIDMTQFTNVLVYTAGTPKLVEIDMSGWDLSNVTKYPYGSNYWYAQLALNLWTSNDNKYILHAITNNWILPRYRVSMDKIITNYRDYHVDVYNWKFQCPNGGFQLFHGFQYLSLVHGYETWDVSAITNMAYMFSNCSGITSIDLTKWDISNVKSMDYMFNRAYNLIEVRMGGKPGPLTGLTMDSNEYYDYEPSEDNESYNITLDGTTAMFNNITTTGKFYYNKAYDYSKIIAQLPSTWTAVPCTLSNGVLIP